MVEKTQSNTELIINKNQHVKESPEELTSDERNVLELFLIALNKRFINDSIENKIHVIPIGRAVILMLSVSELPENKNVFQTNSDSLGTKADTKIKTRYEKIVEYFKNKPSITNSCDGKTVDYFTNNSINDGLDSTNFVHKRRTTRCVYKGESVQAYWSVWNGGDVIWKKAWCIVGGNDGGTALGCAGTVDLVGDIDLFTGWFYTSVDHDMCQGFERKCLGPCADELLIAMGEFIAGLANYIPGIEICDGNNPDSKLVISEQELKDGKYSYVEEHPMAGRKIDTPSDWIIDFKKKMWTGPPLPNISDIKASPNPFDQKTGTTISFNLSYFNTNLQSIKMVIELYHKGASEVISDTELRVTCQPGYNQVYWNGVNDHGLPTAIGFFKAVFRMNGSKVKEIENFLQKKLNIGTSLPYSTEINNIKFSPNPFNIKTGTGINFKLSNSAKVSVYIYHTNWVKKSIRTVFENKSLGEGQHGPYAWNGRNNDGIEATNGEYKVKFIVDGKEKFEKGLIKKTIISNATNNSLPTSQVIENIHFGLNPFTIDTGTEIGFNLSGNAIVSIYIYHINWAKKSIKTLFENRSLGKGYHLYKWDGRNNLHKKTTNGEYRVKFVVDETEKTKRGLIKERPKIKVWSWKKKKWIWV